ncbi:MAG TPA: hypothetical protein VF883_09135 [Thermoanaerobaculia bacterium]
MRVKLGLAILFLVFSASPVLAACDSCNELCNDHYQCKYGDVGGIYSECRNVGTCRGCAGWSCFEGVQTEGEEQALQSFTAEYSVAAVVIENRPSVRDGALVQLHSVDRDLHVH